MRLNKLIRIIEGCTMSALVALTLPMVALADGVSPPHRQSGLPPPTEIRDYYPLPNRLIKVEYANGREFLFRVIAIKPRSDCNQVQFNEMKRTITIITQAPSNAYEYILEPLPVMTSRWVAWNVSSIK